MKDYPLISIVIPCLNEEKFIGELLNGLINQTYPQSLIEIFISDGMSTDGTRDIVKRYESNNVNIFLLDNIAKFTPSAMNLGLENANGKYVFILGAHNSYSPDYVEGLVSFALKKKAALVGGMVNIEPRTSDNIAKSVAIVLNHPIGVGNSAYRTGSVEESKVDTVAYGCYDKSFLDKIGFFDLTLKRNQDIELSKRILLNGGEIWYTPDVHCVYNSKSSYKELWDLYAANGKWVIWTVKLTKKFGSLSFRHFVPLGFFVYFTLLPLISYIFPLFSIFALIYFWIIIISSFKSATNNKDLSLFIPLIMAFFVLHFSYGYGSFIGVFAKPK